MKEILQIAKEVFDTESQSIKDLKHQVGASFVSAVQEIVQSKGRVVVTGVGKSGIVGMKMTGTFSSTGTPSFFLAPTDAYHGDLGTISQEDIILAISNSGETNELLQLIPFFKENGNKIISFTSNMNSSLALNSDFPINVAVHKEACPLELAPTSSTTATMAMGDAMAVALMKMTGFSKEDFAQFHPGGTLGKRLLTKVSDVMKSDNLPIASLDAKGRDVIKLISKGKLGCVLVTNEQQEIVGIVTDGDLRRAMEEYDASIFEKPVTDFMTSNPLTIEPDVKLNIAEGLMNDRKINLLIVSSANKPVGIVQIYDIQ